MRLTVLTDRARAAAAGHHLADVVAAACAGGATLVVLREKDLPGAERSALAATLRRVTGEAGVAFGVAAGGPDGVALAVAAGADLVHLAADAPWPGPGATGGMPVGRSCHTPGEVAAAAARGADLVTVSPVFPTASKPGYGPALGPAGVAEAVAAARAGPGPGPAVLALGGIGPGRAAACLAAGAAGVCVMGAVMGATDPAAVSRALADELAAAAAGVVAAPSPPPPTPSSPVVAPPPAVPEEPPPMAADTPAVALTIAGSDSGGGAGIQADLVTFAALGVHGASAVTALTAQNTVGVTGVHVPPVGFLRDQLDAVLDDLAVGAVKTGMLATEEVVLAVAEYAAAGRLPHLVVDPVLVSSTGARLLDPGAEAAYREALFPHAAVVTPNAREAAALLGRPVETTDDARRAAAAIGAWGPRWVVVKAGHMAGEAACDVVVEASTGAVTELCRPRVPTRNDHGTGCTFAAATAAGLALGHPVPRALDDAKRFVHEGLVRSAGWALGAGHGPVGKLGAWS